MRCIICKTFGRRSCKVHGQAPVLVPAKRPAGRRRPLGAGFHHITKERYLADPCRQPSLSSSIADVMVSESPLHAWACHPRGLGIQTDPTAEMLVGSALESLLAMGDSALVVVDADDYRTAAARQVRDQALAAGKVPVKRCEVEGLQAAAWAIGKKLAARGLRFEGKHQVTAIWQEGDVWCRSRMDHWVEDQALIYDLKICDSANPDKIARKVNGFGYDVQWAAYVRGVEVLRPELAGRVRMKWIFAEPNPPYDVVVCRPDGELRALGQAKWKRAVERFGACLQSGKWPGHAETEIEIRALPWAMNHLLEEEARVAA